MDKVRDKIDKILNIPISWIQGGKDGKDCRMKVLPYYLATDFKEKLVHQILSYLCAEIKGMGLSDEDYEIVNNMTGEDVIGMTMDAQFGRITAVQLAEKIVERCKATSQATVDKIVKNLEGKE